MRFLCRSCVVRRSVWTIASASAHFRGCECALTGPRLRTLGPASARSFFTPSTHTCRGIGRCACCPHPIHCHEGSRERVCSFFQLSSITCCRQPAISISAAKFGISCKTAKHFSLHFVYIQFTNNLHRGYDSTTKYTIRIFRPDTEMNTAL